MLMYKCMGGKEIKYTGNKKSAIEELGNIAGLYGWADLIEDGKVIYTCIQQKDSLQTKLIKH